MLGFLEINLGHKNSYNLSEILANTEEKLHEIYRNLIITSESFFLTSMMSKYYYFHATHILPLTYIQSKP